DGPRRVRQIGARDGLSECFAGLDDVVEAVVGAVEQVEHFQKAIDRHSAAQSHTFLQAHLDAVDRLANEALARNNRSVQSHSIAAVELKIAGIAAADHLRSLTGAVKVPSAQLEAVPDLPDAVEDQPMTLIGFRQRALAAEVLRHRERDLVKAAERLRVPAPETGQGIGERALPPVTQPPGQAGLQP